MKSSSKKSQKVVLCGTKFLPHGFTCPREDNHKGPCGIVIPSEPRKK